MTCVSSSTIWSAGGRVPAGLSVMLNCTWFDGPMLPTFTVYDATFVSVASFVLVELGRSRIISVNDVPCAASAVAFSDPVSSGGNSPFGMIVHSDAGERRG